MTSHLTFEKYTGCGNDFILVDNRSREFPKESSFLISRLCHRHYGIGADGVLLAEEGPEKGSWAMRIFNADGSEASMCGNGLRCFIEWLFRRGEKGPKYRVHTQRGIMSAERHSAEHIRVDMGKASDIRWQLSLPADGEQYEVHHINTGVPHLVLFVQDLDEVDVLGLGGSLRHHPWLAPAGANVNFVQVSPKGAVTVRTYERGVEGETLACGTGMTAAALAAHHLFGISSPVMASSHSGESIEISFAEDLSHVSMTGSATFLFEGKIDPHHLLHRMPLLATNPC